MINDYILLYYFTYFPNAGPLGACLNSPAVPKKYPFADKSALVGVINLEFEHLVFTNDIIMQKANK